MLMKMAEVGVAPRIDPLSMETSFRHREGGRSMDYIPWMFMDARRATC